MVVEVEVQLEVEAEGSRMMERRARTVVRACALFKYKLP